MNRFLKSMLVLVAVAFGAMPVKAATIPTYSQSGSNAQVFHTPTISGDISGINSVFNLKDVLELGNTSNGHYGEEYIFIPFTVTSAMALSATATDLSVSDSGAAPLKWLSLTLYSYTGSKFTNCDTSALCSLIDYGSTPPDASVFGDLVAGTQYLLQVGFGFCGCSGDYAGINLAVTTTPIPPAVLMFLSALIGMGALTWRRRAVAVKAV